MHIRPVGNRDRCGKCGTRHGGNNHICDVHGKVSSGCCEPSCSPADYVEIWERDEIYPKFELKLRSEVNLTGLELDPPYQHEEDNGTGNYKPEYVERYIK